MVKLELMVALVALALSAAALLRMRGLVVGARGFADKLSALADEIAALRDSISAAQAAKDEAVSQRQPARGESDETGAPPRPEPINIEALDKTVRGLASTVQVLEMRAQEHDALLCALVTEDEARHLWNLSQGEPTEYELLESTEMELRSLVRRKLIAKKSDFNIHELSSSFVLTDYFALTDAGDTLLELRKVLEESDRAPATSLPPPASRR